MLTLVPSLGFAEHVIDDTNNPGYLFVMSGTSGSSDGETLTLNGVPGVVYFTDRPARQAGQISLSKFVEMWSNGGGSFKADPPNAVLSILSESTNQNIVIELQDPSIKRDVVSFKIKILQGTALKKFKESSLFIDIGNTGNGNVGL
jgi:hypothetical protein